ncbi:hypothetical protein [Chryseobacterium arthrosphaerae]|uniref:Uncharacterized protein n=1 Tax=Chryseobacterium arthrosphaerae TaxID=651561 RepID=A0A1B8ZQ85_9FLAO|nr:hypothetical protein [Chryseobacterium arthrosphaerae]OCA73724.1 hypothetical protein BBI00_04910 [Chryseobacterium arthrosphaerae]
MLSGKAKTDFEQWLKDEIIFHPEGGFDKLADKFQDTLIIEWLDSINIFLIPWKGICSIYPWQYKINENIYCGIPNRFETRQQALEKGISRAIEIYNM